MMKLISVITPCYNEEDNVDELADRIRQQFEQLPGYDFEHIYIDNASTDRTVEKIKKLAAKDHRVKLIVNTRNFGQIRSPIHAIMQASGDAVVAMAADLQDPPEFIPKFIRQWEQGYKVVVGVKPKSKESPLMFFVRTLYYRIIGRISSVSQIENFTGFGLYDRHVIETIRALNDPYPYFRGIIAELGFEHAVIEFEQPRRARGITKNNFYTLYDMAMLGITSHSKVPIRLATMAGFSMSMLSLLIALTYLVLKLMFWDSFAMGTAPILIGMFFLGSVQLFFVGILGEYIGSIHTYVMKRPMVVEKERINFSSAPK